MSSYRTIGIRVLAILAFCALIAFGPFSEHTLAEKIFTTTLVSLTTLFMLFLSGRWAFSLLFASLVFGTLEIASRLKFTYLATPLLAPDLFYFINGETLGVISRYPPLLVTAIATVVLIPTLLLLAFFSDHRNFLHNHPRAVQYATRILGVIASTAVLTVTAMPSGPFQKIFNKPMWLTINDRSYLTNFFTSFNDTEIVTPAIAADIDRTLSWALERPLQAPQKRPDIIAILEESTFDPRIMPICTLPQCKRYMFMPDTRTRANGHLAVHTFGGGTWVSEFSFLTGLAHQLFGNAGAYAPYNLSPRITNTLPKTLKQAGYRTVAIYPMTGDFLNARNAYGYYGFDAFYDGTEYGLDWESHDVDLLRVFQQIYTEEKQNHNDQPLFVFMLTIHQHGPHMEPLTTLPSPYNKPFFPGKFPPKDLDDWLNLNLNNYLERLQQSDAMLSDLENYLFDNHGPIVLMHFGDHQPSFGGALNVIQKKIPGVSGPTTNMITYYMLKSNYSIRRRFDYPLLDIAYLGSLLLDVAGVPQNAFYQANTLLRERCKGRYLDCKNEKVLTTYHDYIFNHLHALHD